MDVYPHSRNAITYGFKLVIYEVNARRNIKSILWSRGMYSLAQHQKVISTKAVY